MRSHFSDLTGRSFLKLALATQRNPSFWMQTGPKHVERLRKILPRAMKFNHQVAFTAGGVTAVAVAVAFWIHSTRGLVLDPIFPVIERVSGIGAGVLAGVGVGALAHWLLGSWKILRLDELLQPLVSTSVHYEQAMNLLAYDAVRRYCAQIRNTRRTLLQGDVVSMHQLAAADRKEADTASQVWLTHMFAQMDEAEADTEIMFQESEKETMSPLVPAPAAVAGGGGHR